MEPASGLHPSGFDPERIANEAIAKARVDDPTKITRCTRADEEVFNRILDEDGRGSMIPAPGTQRFAMWADSTAIDMRAYFEANRPLTWREWLFGRREYVESCVADDLMLGLLMIVIGGDA